jgi:hypothetical protein
MVYGDNLAAVIEDEQENAEVEQINYADKVA